MSEKNYKKSIVWLRRDLRLKDNTALSEASKRSENVLVVFCFDQNILKKLQSNDRRLTFIIQTLDQLNQEISESGGELITLHGDPKVEIPALMEEKALMHCFSMRTMSHMR